MIRIRHLINSSLWIAVFIVRVGCIIEAHATTIETAIDLTSSKDSKEILSSSRQAGVKKKILSPRRLFTSRSLSTPQILKSTSPSSSITSSHPHHDLDDDSCSGKADGYFPNYGSDCTSYYFCAAGYQITYVCPPDSRFNDKTKKCHEDTVCQSKGQRQNLCDDLPNGYYTKQMNSPKYFYCHNNAKVIDLVCDYGKVFDGNKCVLPLTTSEEQDMMSRLKDLENISCEGRLNGFYPIPNSGCSKYYFCINGVKTELRCETRLVFNGQICVHPNEYKCPVTINNNSSNSNTINDTNLKENYDRQSQNESEIYSFDSTTMSRTSF